jgi:hypothetical protein
MIIKLLNLPHLKSIYCVTAHCLYCCINYNHQFRWAGGGTKTIYCQLFKEIIMKLNAPKNVTWWIAVIIGVLGVLGSVVTLPVISTYYFLFVVVGFVLLALATLLKGL